MNLQTIIYICLIIIFIIILISLVIYNNLIKLHNEVINNSSNIDVLLNKRFDLIPNLVECVKGYSNYEGSTLEEIVKLRNSYNNMDNINAKEASNLDRTLTKYLALVENYPNLKANEQYLDLQDKLSILENQLVRARIKYNKAVTEYNTAVEIVPNNIVAFIFAFKKAELLKLEDYKKENTKVEF